MGMTGVQIRATSPRTYEMQYLDGRRRYNEPFAVVHLPPEYVNDAGNEIDRAISKLAQQMSDEGGELGSIGGFLLEIAYHLVKNANLDPDGGLSLYLAYHYYGTKAGGIDLTARPIPGVDPRGWRAAVDGFLRVGAGRLNVAGVETATEDGLRVKDGRAPEGDPAEGN